MPHFLLLFLALISTLKALSWDELEMENRDRIKTLSNLFDLAMDKANVFDATIALMGSHSYGVSMFDSDVEFVIIIDKMSECAAYSLLVEEFYKLCKDRNIDWDKNGWHPPVKEMKQSADSKILISTPFELAKIRASYDNTTLQYALYNPRYAGGNRQIFDHFEEQILTTPNPYRHVIQIERAKTVRTLESTRRNAKALKRVLEHYHFSNITIDIKKHWIKPAIELIQYLCIKNQIREDSLKSALKYSQFLYEKVMKNQEIFCGF